jgi:DNA adenine methylase
MALGGFTDELLINVEIEGVDVAQRLQCCRLARGHALCFQHPYQVGCFSSVGMSCCDAFGHLCDRQTGMGTTGAKISRGTYAYVIDMPRFRVTSRAEFERLKALPGDRWTDLQRAVRFLYLQRLAFGGKVEGRNFGVDRTGGARFNVNRLEPMLAEIHDRLAGVVIEQLGYAEFIRRYDTSGTLFYLDPPYWGCETDYGQDVFSRGDFEALAVQLAGINGRFLLSINDTPGVRAVFAAFQMREFDTTYTVGGKGATKAAELLMSNFDTGS